MRRPYVGVSTGYSVRDLGVRVRKVRNLGCRAMEVRNLG
jgi:hypothetical protein